MQRGVAIGLLALVVGCSPAITPTAPVPTASGPTAGAIVGQITSVPLPPGSRLAVQVCEPMTDCDRWLYPEPDERFEVLGLDPADYAVIAWLETPSGLAKLTSVTVSVVSGQTVTVRLVVSAIPSMPST